jgi:hypothetical protein
MLEEKIPQAWLLACECQIHVGDLYNAGICAAAGPGDFGQALVERVQHAALDAEHHVVEIGEHIVDGAGRITDGAGNLASR